MKMMKIGGRILKEKEKKYLNLNSKGKKDEKSGFFFLLVDHYSSLYWSPMIFVKKKEPLANA